MSFGGSPNDNKETLSRRLSEDCSGKTEKWDVWAVHRQHESPWPRHYLTHDHSVVSESRFYQARASEKRKKTP
eukprot:6395527-Amphidinium_carterae.1